MDYSYDAMIAQLELFVDEVEEDDKFCNRNRI
jgi:hypothetical protein